MLAVVAVSLVIFGRVAPREARAASRRSLLPPRQELASFILAEYLNNLVTNVMAFVPPLLILYLLGARAAAYFNVPWLIIIVAQTLLWNIGMSFIAESTRHVHQIAAHVRHTIRLGIVVVVGCTMALLIGAPLIVGLQGQEFAAEGVVLLRLLALTFPFTAVVIMYSLVAILERRLWRLVAVNTLGAMTLVLALLEVTPRSGIWSVGAIYLIIQAALAALLLPSLVIRLRSGLIALPEGTSGDGPDRRADTTERPVKTPVPLSELSSE
jgi:O-antigen/teichoic acid export membrane protein